MSSVIAVPGSSAELSSWCAGFVVPRTWDLPRPRDRTVTPALADGFLTRSRQRPDLLLVHQGIFQRIAFCCLDFAVFLQACG